MKNKFGEELHICRKCKINHYTNCGTCYGFGVFDNGLSSPVNAWMAHNEIFPHKVLKCPECGSDEKGLPKHDSLSLIANTIYIEHNAIPNEN